MRLGVEMVMKWNAGNEEQQRTLSFPPSTQMKTVRQLQHSESSTWNDNMMGMDVVQICNCSASDDKVQSCFVCIDILYRGG